MHTSFYGVVHAHFDIWSHLGVTR